MKKSATIMGFLKCMFLAGLIIAVFIVTPGCSAPDTGALQTVKPLSKPVINSFTAEPQMVSPGQSATLKWDVSGAMKVSISPDIGDVPSRWTKQISPSSTMTYILIATNETGSTSSNVIVRISENTIKPEGSISISIGVDPVTGRNQSFVFLWEQLSLAGQYQLQIAKDTAFTQIVFDSGIYEPSEVTSPALVYQLRNLEAGHTYYYHFRVRGAVTGQMIRSPWSETGVITGKAGFPVSSAYSGVQLLNPGNGCTGCLIQPTAFSWSPYKETTKYQFILARDAGLTDIIKKTEVPTTAYVYDGKLDYDTMYFWQVNGLEPAPSDSSATFSFVTESKPVIVPVTATPSPGTPLWAWVVVGIGVLLIIVTLFLILRAKYTF